MKKILLSLGMLGIVGVLSIGATSAIFSDDEVSTGNTFTAGAIDLTVDNESYYNGELNQGTSWLQTDLDDGQGPADGAYLFFNFDDVKPGDWGEDTISLHVNDNDSWLCVDVTLTSDDDNGLTEPEEEDGDNTDGVGEGELADAINFMWWADDGDNVYETDEDLLPAGPLGNLAVGETASVALADSSTNIWDDLGGPLLGDTVHYLGKAWCLGVMNPNPVTPGDNDPTVDPGFTCDGAPVDNMTQTDSMSADIAFHAEQARHNDQFVCEPLSRDTGLLTVTKVVEGGPLAIGDFDLFANAIPMVSGVQAEVPADTLITVSEVDDSGLYEAAITGNCAANGEITLALDEVGSCTITNTYNPGAITVDKIVSFSSEVVDVTIGDFELFIEADDGPIQVTDESPETGLPAGNYTVSENYTGVLDITVDAQYSGACTDDGATGSMTLGHGDNLTCTITNVITVNAPIG
ncbi:CalY family protein [Candidatus Pacebacteria bacterium]|nr:CalY family protein [Candidatus Paceibacterota bacterium]